MSLAIEAVERLHNELREFGPWWLRLTDYGVLHIDLGIEDPIHAVYVDRCVFDEKEIIVLSSSGRVVSFTIHAFAKYWVGHMDELSEHLRKYLRMEKRNNL